MTLVYSFEPIKDEQAQEIAAWRYETPYDFYDVARDPEDLEELLAPERRRTYYAAVSDGEELAGFFCFGSEVQVPGGDYADDGTIDIGLGLRPDLVGKRLGLGFVLAGLEFTEDRFGASKFRLTVATFNECAIRVYERAGFRRKETFDSNKGDSFLITVREG